jgi:YHS domain-containing protein
VENRVSVPKLNPTSYTYLSCADSSNFTSGKAISRVVSPGVSRAPRVTRPIAGEKLQDEEKKLSNIIGKTYHFPNNHSNPSFTLADLLPPVQRAPTKPSGEFNPNSNANYQITTTNTNVKRKIILHKGLFHQTILINRNTSMVSTNNRFHCTYYKPNT